MNFLNKIRPKNLVKLSILFSVIIFLCVNIITNNVFNSSRIDFTEKNFTPYLIAQLISLKI